jgi:hypothetical protein
MVVKAKSKVEEVNSINIELVEKRGKDDDGERTIQTGVWKEKNKTQNRTT